MERVCKQKYLMSVIMMDNTLTIFTFFLLPNLFKRSINQKNIQNGKNASQISTFLFLNKVRFEAIRSNRFHLLICLKVLFVTVVQISAQQTSAKLAHYCLCFWISQYKRHYTYMKKKNPLHIMEWFFYVNSSLPVRYIVCSKSES